MEAGVYEIEAQVEQTHWWFVGRRKLFAREIVRLETEHDAAILDIGTSTGTNLRLFQELGYTNVRGLDRSSEAIRFCEEKGLGPVHMGDIGQIPFPDNHFDLVLATDIIEHVDDDIGALQEVCRVLKPGGYLLLTAPTFQCLWGLQDMVSMHKRRYRLEQLTARMQDAGFNIGRSYYFNYLLFLPIWAARTAIRFLGIRLESENQLNKPWLNWVLNVIFSADTLSAPLIKPPFGVSALLIGRRNYIKAE